MTVYLPGRILPLLWEELYNRYNNTRIRFNRYALRLVWIRKLVERGGRSSYACPICEYEGPFIDTRPYTGVRQDAICPSCRCQERHRLQRLVIEVLREQHDFSRLRLLHFAPETFFSPLFASWFGSYTTSDLDMEEVDV